MPPRDRELASHFSLQKNLKIFWSFLYGQTPRRYAAMAMNLHFIHVGSKKKYAPLSLSVSFIYRSNEIGVSRCNLKVAGSATIFIFLSLCTYV